MSHTYEDRRRAHGRASPSAAIGSEKSTSRPHLFLLCGARRASPAAGRCGCALPRAARRRPLPLLLLPSPTNRPLFHANGLPLLTFEWNDKKARESAQRYVSQLLLQPPLCHDMQTAAQASLSVDARDLSGWDIGSVQPMNEPMNEDAQERSDSEEEDEL